MKDTISGHTHQFASNDWPFADASNTVAFTSARVLTDDRPMLLVSHDQDGDWQFLCGSEDSGECVIVCLGCAFERDRTVGLVADLPIGWQAWRDSVSDRWHRELREPDQE